MEQPMKNFRSATCFGLVLSCLLQGKHSNFIRLAGFDSSCPSSQKRGMRRVFLITNEDNPHSKNPGLRSAAIRRAKVSYCVVFGKSILIDTCLCRIYGKSVFVLSFLD